MALKVICTTKNDMVKYGTYCFEILLRKFSLFNTEYIASFTNPNGLKKEQEFFAK